MTGAPPLTVTSLPGAVQVSVAMQTQDTTAGITTTLPQDVVADVIEKLRAAQAMSWQA